MSAQRCSIGPTWATRPDQLEARGLAAVAALRDFSTSTADRHEATP
jgi:hypothetical protein